MIVRILIAFAAFAAIWMSRKWLRGDLRYRLAAKRTNQWYRIVPLGQHATPLDKVSSAAQAVVNSLDVDRRRDGLLAMPGGIMIVRHGSEAHPPETYLAVWCRPDPAAIAEAAAKAVGCRAEPLDDMPNIELAGQYIEALRGKPGPAEASPGANANRQADVVTQQLAAAAAPTTLIITAAPLSVRQAAAGSRHVSSHDREATAANQFTGRPLRTRVVAIGETATNPTQLAVHAVTSLPSHRFTITSRVVGSVRAALRCAGFLTTVAGLLWVAGQPVLAAAAACATLSALAVAAGYPNPAEWKITRQLRHGYLFPPAATTSATRQAFTAWTSWNSRGADETKRPKSGLHWPRNLIPMNATQLLTCLAPAWEHAGRTAAYGAGRSVDPPARLTEPTPGATRLGYDSKDRWVWLDDAVRFDGVFAVGSAGSGKTAALLDIWLGDCATKTTNEGLLWLEVKGPGRDKAVAAAKAAGVEPVVFDLALPGRGRLDLFGGANPKRAAQRFVAAMRYAFPDGMGDDNTPVLESAFLLALVAPFALYQHVPYADGLRNVMRFAGLLTGLGDPKDRQALMDAIRGELAAHPASSGDSAAKLHRAWHEWMDAETRAERYYQDKRGLRDHPLNSSRNKIKTLLAYEHLWQPRSGRRDVSVAELLERHAVAVVNVAPPAGADANIEGAEVDGRPHEVVRSVVMKLLHDELLGPTCQGWYNHGRSTTLFCDELSEVAVGLEAAAQLVANLRDKAREAGLRLVFACQRIDQLPDKLRAVMGGFGCLVWMRQQDSDTAAGTAAMIEPNRPDAWLPSDITGLRVLGEKGGYAESIVRMRSQQATEPPFTLRWPFATDIDPDEVRDAA